MQVKKARLRITCEGCAQAIERGQLYLHIETPSCDEASHALCRQCVRGAFDALWVAEPGSTVRKAREVPPAVKRARENYRRGNIETRRIVREIARERGLRIPFTQIRISTSTG